VLRLGEFLTGALKRRVSAAFEFRDTRRVNVEANRRVLLAEFNRQRQADIAKTDNTDTDKSRI
jgi:hypothetical protein